MLKRMLSFTLALVLLCQPVGMLQANAAEIQETEITEWLQVDAAAFPENGELYDAYIEGLFYDRNDISFLGELARAELNTQGQGLYDYLKESIQQVAAGERSSASFKITYDQILSWGGAGIYDVADAQSALAAFMKEFQLDSVVDALLHDCPYDLYWFDKLGGVGIAGGVASSTAGYKVSYVKLNFKVVTDYQPADYVSSAPTFDTTNISGAAAAAANAKLVVTQYANASDYEKLLGYKDAICERVSYNYSVSAGDFSTDNDPWQLIYVFDNDSTTNVVCEGYSKAFQYLCDQTYFGGSVDCYSVTGTLIGSGGHMWNIVTLEGQNYLVDVTNSDSGCIGSDGSLFLAGGIGSITGGYTIGSTGFTYDSDSMTLWGTGDNSILKLAETGYDPNNTEEETPKETIPETTAPEETEGPHVHDYTSTVIAPTCTEQGYTTYTCSCGDSYVDDYVDAAGHSYTDDNDVICDICGYVRETGSGDESTEEAFPFSDFEWEVLKLTNAERAAEGLNPLTGFTTLQEAGDIRADELIELFSHTRPDGTSCFTIFSEVGLTYSAVAENIASGYRTPAAVVDGWMNSSGHRTNIMNSSYAHIGIGENSYHWVQLFLNGGKYTSIEVADQKAEPGTSIDDMDLIAVLNSSVRGTCYLPVTASYCTGFDPDVAGDQAVTISVLGVSTTFSVHVHNWTDANCTTPKTCTLCGDTTGEALSHSYAPIVTDPTCTESGYTTYTCTLCGDSYVGNDTDALGHSYNAVVTKPTCTAAGYTTHTCTACGDSYEDDQVDALGHDWADATCTAPKTCNVCGATEGGLVPHTYEGTETDPTCTEAGYVTWVCDNCGDNYITQTQAPLGHTEVTDTAVAPTCTESGLTEGSHCSVCGDTIVAQEVIPALGHTYDNDQDDTCNACSYQREVSGVAVPEKPYKIVNVVSGSHIYWKSVDGAVKYGLWRSETGKNGTYKWLANPTVPHFTDIKVESGKIYYYRVTAIDPATGKHSALSEPIGITYVSTPDITSRTNIATGVQLGWQKIEGATGYAIYRKSYDGDDAWTRIGTIPGNETFTWTDTSAKNSNGEIFRYTIRALAGSDMKTLSGCRNTGRTMVRLSSQVLKSAAKASATSIKCTWTTSSRVTGYEVRFMVDGAVYKTYTVGNCKTGVKTFTGLKAGNTYTIQVRTYKRVDGVGSFYSDWSVAKRVDL